MGTGANCGNTASQITFNIIYIAKGHDEETTILVGKYHGYFWRKVNQNQQYTACC